MRIMNDFVVSQVRCKISLAVVVEPKYHVTFRWRTRDPPRLVCKDQSHYSQPFLLLLIRVDTSTSCVFFFFFFSAPSWRQIHSMMQRCCLRRLVCRPPNHHQMLGRTCVDFNGALLPSNSVKIGSIRPLFRRKPNCVRQPNKCDKAGLFSIDLCCW